MEELPLDIRQALKTLGLKHRKTLDSIAQCSDERHFNGGRFGCLRCDVISVALSRRERQEKRVAKTLGR